MKDKWDEYIVEIEKNLPHLIKHFHIANPKRLFGIKITLQQYVALGAIAKKGKAMVSELSKILEVAFSTVTELIVRLEKRHLVIKERDNSDKRIIWVKLTNRGLNLLQKINSQKKQHIKSILEKLEVFERETLIKALISVANIVQKIELAEK